MPNDIEFVLLTGAKHRVNCPTSTAVKTQEKWNGNVVLYSEEFDRYFPAYICPIDDNHLEIFTLIPYETGEQEIELVLSEDYQNDSPRWALKPMEIVKRDGNSIEIKKNGATFGVFRYPTEDVMDEKTGLRPNLMPLMGPFGDPLTREYPLKKRKNGTDDHIHHRSLWCAWGDVNGTDNWSEGITAVPQIVKEIEIMEAGNTLSHIRAKIEWMDKDGEKPILDEVRDIIVYNSYGMDSLIDWRITFNASYEDITFGDTKEAGFISVRVADEIRGAAGGFIENSLGGMMESQCWGKKASWCDYYGNINGHIAGIAVMDHPENAGYPARWHVRDYGLMAANPIARKAFNPNKDENKLILPKGETLSLRYRVYLHAGDPRKADVAGRYVDFVYPPELKHLEF